MIVEIDIKSLKDFGITADEYVYLQLLQSGSHDVIDDLKLVVRLEVMQTKGLVKLGESTDQHVVRDRFSSANSTPFDQMWSELLSHFPLKVYANGPAVSACFASMHLCTFQRFSLLRNLACFASSDFRCIFW